MSRVRHFFSRSILVRLALLIAVAIGIPLTVAGSMVSAASPAGPLDWELSTGGHFFTQTGGKQGMGFGVSDADAIPFWSEFLRQGEVSVLGYPVSKRFVWEGFTTQVFQRGVLAWHPQEKRVLPVNLLDVLHDRGKDDWLLAVKGVPKPLDASFDQGKNWSQIVVARQALLDGNAAIKSTYFSAPDPMVRYGLPTSRLVDNGSCVVVRLQRAVIQQWKIDVPWARAGEVTIALAGDLAREAGIFQGSDSWAPEDGSKVPPKWGWQVFNGTIPDGERWIDVNITEQSATAMVGNQAVFRAPATTGKSTFPTPLGTFYIYSRVYNETMDSQTLEIPRDSSEGYNLKDVYYTQYFLSGGFAIHTNYWMPDSVFGSQATSHGCVGMRIDNAKFFWDFASIGTKIVLHK